MVKIHTDKNVADLLTKAFDVRKAKKSVRLMMEELCKNRQSDLVRKRIERVDRVFGMELELILATIKAKTVSGEVQLQALVYGKKIIINESTVRRDLQLEDAEGVDCLPNATIFEQLALMGYEQVPQSSVPSYNVTDKAVYKELDDSLVRATTTASSLEAEQDSGNIIKTRSKATPNEAGSQGTTSGGGPSGEDSLKLNELMELCTNLQQRVLDLETKKTTQANEIASLERRVKKLEKKDRSRTHKLKRLYKVSLSARVESSRDEEDLGKDASKQGKRIHDIDVDEDITLVNDDNEIFDVDTLAVSAATIIDVEITLAQALAELKSVKPKADKDKVKGIMIEEPMVEQVKPMKRLEQIRLDEELAFKLQAEEEKEEEEEERLAREKAQQIEEANIA
ncbi:hypothetical protein Tco_0190334 [Tanacetum coccineum]